MILLRAKWKAAAGLSQNSRRTLTAFVREVVLPAGPDRVPELQPYSCRFSLSHAKSRIHRWGIFTNEGIPARRRVIEYTGQRIGFDEVRRRRLRPQLYIFRLNDKHALDGAIGGSGAEFINHSCEPNLYAKVGRGHIWLVSLRRIEPGEELLLDYRIRGETKLIRCACRAPGCRGYLNWPGE